MPTALEYAEATLDFLDGKDPGPEYRTKYNNTNIVGYQPAGSQNIPLVQARNALIYNRVRKMSNIGLLDAWEEYAKLNFMTTETFSCNIYAAWILESIQVAHAAAEYYQHPAEAGLRNHLQTAMALAALASGWKENTAGFDGYPCVITGARSWNGPARYMTSASSFWSGWMQHQLFGTSDRFYNGLARLFNYKIPFVGNVSPFLKIVDKQYTDWDLELMQSILDVGPKPGIFAKIIRTDKSVFFGCETSVNTGSTCFLPAKYAR